jgi:hypothetical protein
MCGIISDQLAPFNLETAPNYYSKKEEKINRNFLKFTSISLKKPN